MSDSPFAPGAALHPVSQFRCPYCGSHDMPRTQTNISTAGIVLFIVLLLFLCLPLCWIGLLIQESHRYCVGCGMKLS